MDNVEVEAAIESDPGRKRSQNQDWIECYEPNDLATLRTVGRLFVVADGVGGAKDGHRASKYAAQKIVYEHYHAVDSDLGERLRQAISAANTDIYGHSENSHASQPMGTTVVAAALRGRELVIANVGDSRAYHWRDGQLRQVTRDHSLVQQLQDEGQLSTEEAQSFRRRNVILRSVGADDYIEVDLFHSEARPGDRLLLCSDGLHKYFPDLEELGRMASAQPPQEAVHTLVQAANARGGSDNISVVIVALREPQTRRVASQARPAVAAPNWDELPTGPRPLRAGSAAGAAAIGSSARPQQVALLISLLVLSLMMVVAGILVARQVFAPAVVPTDAPTQPPPATSVPVMATAAPSEAAAPTVTLVTEMPPTQAPTLPPALSDTGAVPTVVPATAQAPTSPALTVDWSDGTLCEWTVAPGDNLHQLYSRLAGLAPAGGSSPEAFVARVVQANPALDPASGGNPDRLDVGQKILLPWPTGLSPLADGSPPICPAL